MVAVERARPTAPAATVSKAGSQAHPRTRIRAALVGMDHAFHRLVLSHVSARRRPQRLADLPAEGAAWALLGLATNSNVVRELQLPPPPRRQRMFAAVAGALVGGADG